MPSNIIEINYSKELSWTVVDSKMVGLIAYLDGIGERVGVDPEEEVK